MPVEEALKRAWRQFLVGKQEGLCAGKDSSPQAIP